MTYPSPRIVHIALSFVIALACVTGCGQPSTADPDASAGPAASADSIGTETSASPETLATAEQESGSAMKQVSPAPTKSKETEQPESPPELLIGSDAPPLDIQHWVSTGGFETVSDFESGKVYVVEFWATWCGPCVASMPHLAELQESYRDMDVQIISTSNESIEEVEAFLEREVPDDSDRTYGELTSAYSLTTDPDKSVYTDYMQAASESAIPRAFIVGKNGQIEWIGHPLKMDDPLRQVLADDWDREAFKIERQSEQKFTKLPVQVQILNQQGKANEALSLIDEELRSQIDWESSQGRGYLLACLFQRTLILLGKESPDAVDAFKELTEIVDQEQEAETLGDAAFVVLLRKQRGRTCSDALLSAALQAVEKATQLRPENLSFLDTQARLAQARGDLDLAIETQTKLVGLVQQHDGMLKSAQAFLDELQAAKAEEEGDGEDTEEDLDNEEDTEDEEATEDDASDQDVDQ